jgi:hypothetical protein
MCHIIITILICLVLPAIPEYFDYLRWKGDMKYHYKVMQAREDYEKSVAEDLEYQRSKLLP